MVIIQRPIQHYDQYGMRNEGVSLIKSASISGKILQGSAENSLNGLLFQLSSLSLVASEMFQSISATSKSTFDRISALHQRVQNVNNQLTEVEEYMMQNSRKMFTTLGYNFTEKSMVVLQKIDQQNISAKNFPTALTWQYDQNCEALPAFDSSLDTIRDTDDGNEAKKVRPCVQYYSRPNFFFEFWAKEELRRQKNERKAARKKRKQEKELKQQKAPKVVNSIQLHYKKFDKEGNRIVDDTPQRNPSLDFSANDMTDTASSPMARTESFRSPSTPSVGPPPPGPPPSMSVGPPPPGPPPPMTMGSGPKPPVGPPPPGPPQRTESFHRPNPSPPTGPPPPQMNNYTPPPTVSVGPPPPGPPPPPSFNAPPPPMNSAPQINASSGGGGSLADMMANVSLKKAEQAPKQEDDRGSLLEQIRRGKKLAAASERKIPEKKEEKKEMDVAAILNNKFASVLADDSDTESDSEFSDDDWE